MHDVIVARAACRPAASGPAAVDACGQARTCDRAPRRPAVPGPAAVDAFGHVSTRDRAFCQTITRHAVRSLYAELTLYPKPGLVSLVDNGSHSDMTAATFLRSLFALRHYFRHITRAGMEDAPFATLKRLGIDAEARMLRATGGINTHRGAVFCLGLLCAAIGRCRARGSALTPAAIRATLLASWGKALAAHTDPGGADSHGLRAARRYAASGARDEAARGLPSVFELALPALESTLAAGRGMRRARVDALFALMGHISDTNLYHRGGEEGALTVRRHARAFVIRGGTARHDWEAQALACHRVFVAARLSPGGAADLLAASCLVHEVCRAGDACLVDDAGMADNAGIADDTYVADETPLEPALCGMDG